MFVSQQIASYSLLHVVLNSLNFNSRATVKVKSAPVKVGPSGSVSMSQLSAWCSSSSTSAAFGSSCGKGQTLL